MVLGRSKQGRSGEKGEKARLVSVGDAAEGGGSTNLIGDRGSKSDISISLRGLNVWGRDGVVKP